MKRKMLSKRRWVEDDQPDLGQAPGGGVEINHLWSDPKM
jgi:hypothetical protein